MPVLTLRRFLLGSFPAMRRLPLMRWITCSSRWNTSNQIFDLSIFYALSKRWTTCSLALTKMETNSWLSKRFLCSLRITVFSNHTTANSPPVFNYKFDSVLVFAGVFEFVFCSSSFILVFLGSQQPRLICGIRGNWLWRPPSQPSQVVCFLSASSISTLLPSSHFWETYHNLALDWHHFLSQVWGRALIIRDQLGKQCIADQIKTFFSQSYGCYDHSHPKFCS